MIKKLVSHLGEYKRAAVLTPLFAALEAVMDVLLPTIMAFIIDQGIEKGDMNAIIRYGLLTFLVAAIALVLGVLAGKYAAEASTGFAGNLRDAMYENIQHYSFSNIDKFSTAGLVTRMTTDVTNIQNAYQMILRMAIRAPSSMVIAMIMAFTINAKLASIYLVAVIILGGCLVLIMSRASNYFSAAFKKYDDLNENVQENVSAIRVVKAYVREDYESEKFKKASGNVQELLLDGEQIVGAYKTVRDQAVFTTHRIFMVDMQGMTGTRQEIFVLPYRKILHYGIKTAGFGDPLQTSELTVCFADEHEAKFGFIGQDELLAVARAISRCIL